MDAKLTLFLYVLIPTAPILFVALKRKITSNKISVKIRIDKKEFEENQILKGKVILTPKKSFHATNLTLYLKTKNKSKSKNLVCEKHHTLRQNLNLRRGEVREFDFEFSLKDVDFNYFFSPNHFTELEVYGDIKGLDLEFAISPSILNQGKVDFKIFGKEPSIKTAIIIAISIAVMGFLLLMPFIWYLIFG
ncbi:MAG: hypothetical protein ACOCXG_01970 [Nanoarchaeota archaeon]